MVQADNLVPREVKLARNLANSRVAVLLEVYGSAYGTGSRIKEVHVLEHIPYTPGDNDGPSVVPVD